MAAAADKSKKTDAKETKGRKPIVLIAVAGVVAAGLAGGGAWFFLGRSDAGEHAKQPPKTAQVPAPAQYFAMDPPFVVNLNGPVDGPRYLQVEVQLMSRDPVQFKAITDNAPAIRAQLLMLMSQVQSTDIAALPGREKLQKDALAAAQKVMTRETGKRCVEDLLFTSFVTQ